MNLALWKKSFSESRWLLVCSLALMFAVHWLRVWIASFFTTSALESMFGFMPEMVLCVGRGTIVNKGVKRLPAHRGPCFIHVVFSIHRPLF